VTLEGARRPALDTVAVVLGVLAALAVTAALVVLVWTATRQSGPPRQLVTADGRTGVVLEVPGEDRGWQVLDRDTRIAYALGADRPGVFVVAPAVFGADVCEATGQATSRAFVGLTGRLAAGLSDGAAAGRAALGATHRRVARDWLTALTRSPGGGGQPAGTGLASGRRVAADGTPARSSTAVVSLVAGSCNPPRVELTVISLRMGPSVSSAVMVRDLGVGAAGLSDVDARAILASLQRG